MELHLMKLHPLNCCLSIRIKINNKIIFFKIPMKIDKNTSNAYANALLMHMHMQIILCILCKNCNLFYKHSMELH